MFHRGGNDMPFARLGQQGAMNGGVVALGAATGENNLLGIGVDERSQLCAGVIQMTLHLASELIRAGRVAPHFSQEREHGFDDFRRDACGRIVVEIIKLLLAHIGHYADFGCRLAARFEGRTRLSTARAGL